MSASSCEGDSLFSLDRLVLDSFIQGNKSSAERQVELERRIREMHAKILSMKNKSATPDDLLKTLRQEVHELSTSLATSETLNKNLKEREVSMTAELTLLSESKEENRKQLLIEKGAKEELNKKLETEKSRSHLCMKKDQNTILKLKQENSELSKRNMELRNKTKEQRNTELDLRQKLASNENNLSTFEQDSGDLVRAKGKKDEFECEDVASLQKELMQTRQELQANIAAQKIQASVILKQEDTIRKWKKHASEMKSKNKDAKVALVLDDSYFFTKTKHGLAGRVSEDAFGACMDRVVCCDGVGAGGSRSGEFAEMLVQSSLCAGLQDDASTSCSVRNRACATLSCAYNNMKAKSTWLPRIDDRASTTVTILRTFASRINSEAGCFQCTLETCQVGDSCWAMMSFDEKLNQWKCNHVSAALQHQISGGRFAPYQISPAGQKFGVDLDYYLHSKEFSHVSGEFSWKWRSNSRSNVVIVGSDGFWDNVYLTPDSCGQRDVRCLWLEMVFNDVEGLIGNEASKMKSVDFLNVVGNHIRFRVMNNITQNNGKNDDVSIMCVNFKISESSEMGLERYVVCRGKCEESPNGREGNFIFSTKKDTEASVCASVLGKRGAD